MFPATSRDDELTRRRGDHFIECENRRTRHVDRRPWRIS